LLCAELYRETIVQPLAKISAIQVALLVTGADIGAGGRRRVHDAPRAHIDANFFRRLLDDESSADHRLICVRI